MADPNQISGNRVYCHVCHHEWDRAQGGLQCPECASEFVEILEPETPSQIPGSSIPPQMATHPIHGEIPQSPPSLPQHPLHNHNPWEYAPDPDEDDITRIEFNTGRSHGTFSYSSRTFTWGGSGRRDPAAEEIARNFETMLSGLMGAGRQPYHPPPRMGGNTFQFTTTHNARGFGNSSSPPPNLFSMLFPSAQTSNVEYRQGNPLDFLSALFGGANGQHGDAVFTNEAFDRVMTQLMDQNQGTGAPPASEDAINSLKKKPVDKSMMGSDGLAECSICMDNVEIGDEVTFLPCNHWFHQDCVVSWLKEHDTCPHCRKPISNTQEPAQPSGRRRSSQQSSSRTNPTSPPPPEQRGARYGSQDVNIPDRERYYSNPRSPEGERPPNDRDDNSQGGVGGWIRSRMPF